MSILTEGDILGLVGVYGYVLCVIGISYILRDKVRSPRKVVHVLTGGIVFFWWSFDTRLVMAGLAAFPFVPLLILATPKSPVKFLRNSPLGARSSEGHPYGLVMYAVSWTIIAYALFDDLIAASIAIASMSFGDGMGELIGRRYGTHRYFPHRSVEGSAAVFSSTLISILVLFWFYTEIISYAGGTIPYFSIPFAASIAGLVALIEALTPGSIDNLLIPLVIAFVLHGLGV